jgi:hypothetical protein
MKKLMCILMIITLLSIFTVSNVSANTPNTTNNDVDIPVIFDGKSYTASEFAKIAPDLNLNNAVYMPDINGTSVYIFRNLQEFANNFKKNGTFKFTGQDNVPLNGPSNSSITKLRSEDVGWGYNWEDINKGGSCLAVIEDYTRPDLAVYSPSWSYRISSCRLVYDSSKSSNYAMILSPFPNTTNCPLLAVMNGVYTSTLVGSYWYYSGQQHSWSDAACGIYWGLVEEE